MKNRFTTNTSVFICVLLQATQAFNGTATYELIMQRLGGKWGEKLHSNSFEAGKQSLLV